MTTICRVGNYRVRDLERADLRDLTKKASDKFGLKLGPWTFKHERDKREELAQAMGDDPYFDAYMFEVEDIVVSYEVFYLRERESRDEPKPGWMVRDER